MTGGDDLVSTLAELLLESDTIVLMAQQLLHSCLVV
jgi:hypothetical protein